jgi:hypothetical protein
MKNEDKVFLVVAIAAAGFIAYKATRKDDVVAAGGYANAVGRGGLANSGAAISHTRWQPASASTTAPAPVRPTPGAGAAGYSSKPMWMKELEKKIFFWRKDV